jgi:hypothetical protein
MLASLRLQTRNLLILALLASPICAQGTPVVPPVTPGAAGAQPAKPKTESLRISFLGASITAGFQSKLTLARALEAVTTQNFSATDASDLLTFMNPDGAAKKALPKAIEAEPQVAVALDFLFWFVYGRGKEGYEKRKAQLDIGLSWLEQIESPLLVGLIPHITDASRQMLGQGAVPTAKEIERLNADLTAWADKRKTVHVLQVPSWLDALKNGGEVETLGTKHKFSREEILLPDNLHLKRRGVIIAAALVADELVRLGHLEKNSMVKDLAAAEKRADSLGTGFTILVKHKDGKRARQGRLVIDFDLQGLSFGELAQLAPLAEYRMPIDLAKRNPLVARSLPKATLALKTPTVWAFDGEYVTQPKSLRLRDGKRRTISLTLVKGAEINFRVINAKGETVPGIEVVSMTEAQARRLDFMKLKGTDEVFAATSNDKGAGRLAGLGATEHRLYYRVPNTGIWRSGPRVEVDAGAAENVVIEMN